MYDLLVRDQQRAEQEALQQKQRAEASSQEALRQKKRADRADQQVQHLKVAVEKLIEVVQILADERVEAAKQHRERLEALVGPLTDDDEDVAQTTGPIDLSDETITSFFGD